MLAGLLGVVALAEALALWGMAPLKERIPYFIEADGATGRVSAASAIAKEFKPAEANVKFHLRGWVENLLTIDTRTKEYLLPASYAMLRGSAMGEWRDWVENRDQPLKKILQNNGNYRREARIRSVTAVSDGVMLVRVLLVESVGATPQSKVVTIHYALIPPTTEEEGLKNPLGLYITHFTINDEIA